MRCAFFGCVSSGINCGVLLLTRAYCKSIHVDEQCLRELNSFLLGQGTRHLFDRHQKSTDSAFTMLRGLGVANKEKFLARFLDLRGCKVQCIQPHGVRKASAKCRPPYSHCSTRSSSWRDFFFGLQTQILKSSCMLSSRGCVSSLHMGLLMEATVEPESVFETDLRCAVLMTFSGAALRRSCEGNSGSRTEFTI